jgi:DNA-3-methyladenine glycosylase II
LKPSRPKKSNTCRTVPQAREPAAPHPLTPQTFVQGLTELTARDAHLAAIVNRLGPPPFWRRRPCFATLVRIILEQQVSLASARAVFERLRTGVVPFSAANFRRRERDHLKKAGLTRQKQAACLALAEAVASGRLRLEALTAMTDNDARRALLQVKGIGPWTADIYLLMALRRPDIWPRGDLALNKALSALKTPGRRPSDAALAEVAEAWRPWRAVAARVLWHGYLAERGQAAPEGF